MSGDKMHAAEAFMRRVLAEHPQAVEQAQSFCRDREELRDEWPDWCGLPMAAVYAMLTAGADVADATRIMSELPDGITQLQETTAALLWRKSKIIYRYDSDVAQALVDQPLDGELPREALYHLPFYCIFIEHKFKFQGFFTVGFFAWMEYDVPSRTPELRLLYLMQDGVTVSSPVILSGGTLMDSTEALIESARKRAEQVPDMLMPEVDCWPEEPDLVASINMVLYLCSTEPDIPAEGELRQRRTYNPDGAPKRAATLDVGTRIGAALRKAAAVQSTEHSGVSSGHASPVPHIRRAHWHHFWAGPRDGDRSLVVHWLPPIPVNADDEADPVIRPIK